MQEQLRPLLGLLFGLVIMLAVVNGFYVKDFDFGNMRAGAAFMLAGGNPWAQETRLPDFYNPPFAILFLWPLVLITPRLVLVLGGSLLFALVFSERAWVALAWFASNIFLWIVAAGGVDMYVIGAGLLLLLAGDRRYATTLGLILRVAGYGFLLVKPQGGIFIVGLYLLMRGDWKGLLLSAAVYGLPFMRYYPDWLRVLLTDPPTAQVVASQTIMGRFGPWVALPLAVWVSAARRWKFWQLGGVLAGLLSPYGMPGLPVFLILSAGRRLAAVPVMVVFSALLALITWPPPPPSVVDYFAYADAMMAVYNLSMIGLALVLVCLPGQDPEDMSGTIGFQDLTNYVKRFWNRCSSL